MMRIHRSKERGFAATEIVLILVIIGAIVGIGYWVANRNNEPSSAGTPASASSPVDEDKKGTSEGVDQLMSADSDSEAAIDKKYESNEQSNAASSTSAENNLGGAYDEASF